MWSDIVEFILSNQGVRLDISVIFGFVVEKGISDEISGVNNINTSGYCNNLGRILCIMYLHIFDKGHPDAAFLNQSVNDIIRRHQILRTCLYLENGELVQEVMSNH